MKRLRNNRGYTIIEMLVAVLITGILASAGFEFYISMHNQTLAQEEISDMQQASRASLQEITNAAGFPRQSPGNYEESPYGRISSRYASGLCH